MITKKLIKPISKVGIANVDLDNYYNKSEIDSKITTIDNEINTKQDTLTAGSNITISNNVISANVPQIDLSNYYNKQEIDTTINSVNGKVATNTNDIATIKTQQATQDQQISSNRDLSNQIIQGLKTLRVFNYLGTFNATTTYKRNDVVDYNNRLFLSKVDNNVGNTPPSDNQSNTYWLLVDGIQASIDLSDYYTKIEVDDKLQDYLAITTFNNTIQQINTKQQEQDTLISQKANTSDLSGYAKINESNNGNFYIGDKNGKHIWFAQPFQYSGNTYASIKIRNGNANYFTMEHNFNTNQSIISNPRGSVQLKNVATPTENSDGVNKAYVDSQIANIPSTDLTNYYTKSEIDTKLDWELVDSATIIRENGTTTIPLNGKRFIHFQGRFTSYTSNTGSWNNFVPFTLDTQNYNYMVRFPIYDWNTQTLNASIEVSVSSGNVVLQAYNTRNQAINYYLWGDVLVK